MCLITDIKEKFIAQEDMIVYKWLGEDLKSPCQGFQYELGELYTTELGQVDNKLTPCSDGTAQKYLDTKYPTWFEESTEELIAIEYGYHTYSNHARATQGAFFFSKLFTCIIPAGSEYYKDVTGCIVSNQLIITGYYEEV